MAKQFGSQIDLQKIPVLNIVVHSSRRASLPGPVNGMLWYDTTNNVMKVRELGVWNLVGNVTGGSAPTGPAGGDLTGSSYPNPVIAANAVTTAKILDSNVTTAKIADLNVTTGKIALLAVTDAQVAAANKDGAVGTASMRTLGLAGSQAMPGNTRLDQIAVPTNNVPMNNQKITALGTPTADTDAATKLYVDGVAQGLAPKDSVRAATTANITLSAPQTIDGISVIAGDRVLVKDQSTPATNGIYTVAASAWVRGTDMDAWSEVPGAFTFVEQGTVNADSGWVSTADTGGTLGTTAITWTQFSGAGQITAGAGLTKTANTLDVIGTSNRITVAADAVDISTSYVGQASITTLGTITTGTWTGTDIAVADGGTGASTAAAARTNLGAVGKFAGNLGALTAGVEATIAHNLNSMDVIAQFTVVATNRDIVLDWRNTDANNIGVTADVAYGASAIRAVVIG